MSQIGCYHEPHELPKLVQNCHFLQKLSLAHLPLDLDDIQYICENGQTLQVLDLEDCNIVLKNRTKLLQNLFTNCNHLTELNMSARGNILLDQHIQALVDNLTPTILKVDLEYQCNFQDKHVKELVKRCNKLTHLGLMFTRITNDSMHSIIKHLNTSLEILSVSKTKVEFAALLELKSMPTLKNLICWFDINNDENIKTLKLKLPHISISKERCLFIASPIKRPFDQFLHIDEDWIWEIKAKRQDLLPRGGYY